jgi:hypothetical protein
MAESYTEIALTKAIHAQNEDVPVAEEPVEEAVQQSKKRPDSLVYDEPKGKCNLKKINIFICNVSIFYCSLNFGWYPVKEWQYDTFCG